MADAPGSKINAAPSPRLRRRRIYRHALPVRIMHWVNVVCLAVLLMSGLQIFNAHPALYWGKASDFDRPLLAMYAVRDGGGRPVGRTTLFGHTADTTGVLGLSAGRDGQPLVRGFPTWATLPSEQSLAGGRLWHFFFAWLFALNGLAYLVHGIAGGHFRRDLLPGRDQLRHIGRSILDHLRLRFPRGAEARRYNVLQKLSYLAVIFLLAPLIVLAGLAMSPQLDAGFPALPDLFGGRQSARSLHFLAAGLLLAFALVHVLMVLVSGVWNNLRSMVTGRYAIEEPEGASDGAE